MSKTERLVKFNEFMQVLIIYKSAVETIAPLIYRWVDSLGKI